MEPLTGRKSHAHAWRTWRADRVFRRYKDQLPNASITFNAGIAEQPGIILTITPTKIEIDYRIGPISHHVTITIPFVQQSNTDRNVWGGALLEMRGRPLSVETQIAECISAIILQRFFRFLARRRLIRRFLDRKRAERLGPLSPVFQQLPPDLVKCVGEMLCGEKPPGMPPRL